VSTTEEFLTEYEIVFATRATFIARVYAADITEAEEMVSSFSPTIAMKRLGTSVACIDLGYDEITIGAM
jgi:hypothetical protein